MARSSHPVAHTRSKSSASLTNLSPTSRGMQWATPSIQCKGPGSWPMVGAKPNRLITPSTSTKRIGLFVSFVTKVWFNASVGRLFC